MDSAYTKTEEGYFYPEQIDAILVPISFYVRQPILATTKYCYDITKG